MGVHDNFLGSRTGVVCGAGGPPTAAEAAASQLSHKEKPPISRYQKFDMRPSPSAVLTKAKLVEDTARDFMIFRRGCLAGWTVKRGAVCSIIRQ